MSEWSRTLIKTEIEIYDEFCKIEIGDIKPTISPEYLEIHMHETSPQLSALISQLNADASSSLRCRLCAMPNDDMVNIFSSIGTEGTVVDKVRTSLPITIEESDGLPKQACRSCLATLDLCYHFHQTVVQAERQLSALERFASGKLSEAGLNNDKKYNELDGSLKTTSDIEEINSKSNIFSDGNPTADTTVNSNVLLSSLRPCSVVIPIMESCWENNSAIRDKKSSSSNNECKNLDSTTGALLPDRIIASTDHRQSTYESGVHLNSPDIHAPAHVEKRRFKCDTCAKTFKWKSDLIQHMLVHSNEKIACEDCGKKLSSRKAARYHHQRIHSKKGMFECLLCEKSFITPSELKRHALVHSEDRNYHCFLCNKSFKTLWATNSHMMIHTSNKQWQCSHCKRSFLRKYDSKKHSRICKLR